VIGSAQFLGKDEYPKGSTKLRQFSEKVDIDKPGFQYELGTTLKNRDYNLASSGRPDVSFGRVLLSKKVKTNRATQPSSPRRSANLAKKFIAVPIVK